MMLVASALIRTAQSPGGYLLARTVPKQNPVRGVPGGGAKFCGVIRASLGGNLGTSLYLQLQIESDNSELLSGTGPLRGETLGFVSSPPNKHLLDQSTANRRALLSNRALA